MKLKLLLIISVMCLANSAWAATYYVATYGNDSAAGTEAAPWKTPNRAISAVRPGDTVYFRGGDYLLDRYISFNKDGTSAAPITYKNYPGETPTIVYNAPAGSITQTGGAASAYISGDYNILDGINFRLPEEIRRRVMIDNVFFAPGGRANAESVAGIGVYGTGAVLRNCHIDNFSQTPVFNSGTNITVEYCRMTNNASHGLYISSTNGTFRYNILDGSRAFGNQEGFQMQYAKSRGNKVYGNLVINGQAAGVMMSGGLSNNEVFNNVFINPGAKQLDLASTDTNAGARGGHSWAISFWCEDVPMGSGNKIYNNTFMGTSANGLINPQINARCAGTVPGTRVEIYNNIFYPKSSVRVGLSTPNIRNNIFYNITGSVPAGNTLVNPNLVNPSGTTAADAMLQASSPAIDKATSGAPALDYRSGTRPVGAAADIGAYEYGAPAGSGGGPLGGGSSEIVDEPVFPCI